MLAEAQLNYGQPQTDEETEAALGAFDIHAVDDGDSFLLPKHCYAGSPTPLGLQVVEAPHKRGVPAVSYGLWRKKSRLRPEFAELDKRELGTLIRDDVVITEEVRQGVVFFSGDTTIQLLRTRWAEILPKHGGRAGPDSAPGFKRRRRCKKSSKKVVVSRRVRSGRAQVRHHHPRGLRSGAGLDGLLEPRRRRGRRRRCAVVTRWILGGDMRRARRGDAATRGYSRRSGARR